MPSSTRIAFWGIAIAALGAAGCAPRIIDAIDVCCGDGGVVGDSSPPGVVGDSGDAEGGPAKLLLHWYKFDGTGTRAVDSVGGADGTIFNAQLANGYLALPGGAPADTPNPAYVDLPNFLFAGLESVTIEAWVTWNGGDDWQRIFDFGEDMTGVDLDAAARPLPDAGDRTRDGRSYLFLTPQANSTNFPNLMRATYLKPEVRSGVPGNLWMIETAVVAPALPVGVVPQHVAVTIDGPRRTMMLFVNGVGAAPTPLNDQLSDVYDINCWLGRSQFPVDPLYSGRIYEFRIYREALTASQIQANFRAGVNGIAVQ